MTYRKRNLIPALKIPIDIISAKKLQIRTSNTKTRGPARQEKNTRPFKAIKYKGITLLSLKQPLSQDIGRPLFSPVQLSHGLKHRSWEVTGRRSPEEPSPSGVLFLFNTNHKTSYKMNSSTSS